MAGLNPTQGEPTPSQPADAEQETPESTGYGYEICVKVNADGSFAVTKEPLDDATEAAGEGEQPESPESHVNTIDDALRAVLKIYKTNPVNATEETQFQSGHRDIAPSPDMGMPA